ncbi:uncharacterized protein LOC119066060 [Bradysia coprophila]|uniref:uncharacterized protein LOC119066060 n=1 Tax=Bradysia coprophila TaxID=38358 RepID=UPI00187D731B|nr:uncharacterized protein LOC119066060 [Bradysia coprophila]
MILFITLLAYTLACTNGLTITTPTDEANSTASKTQDKRSLLIGDLSYSYSATDIGSNEGSHVKTITVIKNIGAPKYHKHLPHHPYDGWDSDSKNRFNFVFKFPEFPQIDAGTYFHTEKPRKAVPTKQPTNRQTPVFNTDFDTNDFDDQPNLNANNTGPQVFETNPETLPDPMPMVNTETPASREPSDDVEYIQTDGEKSKLLMPTAAMFHSKKVQPTRTSTAHGLRSSNTYCKTCDNKQFQSHRQTPDFIEDFSDFSMHNVKHIVDPMKVKDSILKYTQNQPNLDLKKLTNIESNTKDKKFDSYGNVVQKSQSLLDASQPYKSKLESNAQESKRPYLSPSLKKTYNSPSQPSPSPTKITTTTTPSKGLLFFSTTQKAYVAPKKSKLSENSNPDSSFAKPSTEKIQQPMFSMQLKTDNREQVPEKRNPPPQQLKEEKKPFHSYSIRNPLTTSLPVQHNRPKFQHGKLQSYVAVPIDADIPNKQHLLTMPKRYVRHHIVFDSKPPHPFLESPFQPVKAVLMG